MAKGTRVTMREKRKMWALYQKMGSYKRVAKKVSRSPDTVSKYVKEIDLIVGCQELFLCNGGAPIDIFKEKE